MGTVVSIDVPTLGPGGSGRAIDQVVRWLHWVDTTFSTYNHDSEVSRLGRGELSVEECHPHVQVVLSLCEHLHQRTGGYFDAWAGGHLDPSGLVKGWSIDQASALLTTAGWPDHAIDGGGDVRLRGRPAGGGEAAGSVGDAGRAPWQVALRHPFRPGAFCTVVALEEGAVATSGVYERGYHVIDPHCGERATSIAAVSVIGPCLAMADAYATAALAMGPQAPAWLEALPDHEAFLIDSSGAGWETAGFARYRLDIPQAPSRAVR